MVFGFPALWRSSMESANDGGNGCEQAAVCCRAMYRMLSDDLSRAAEVVRLRGTLRAQHEAVAQRLATERARHARLADKLRREQKDVACLEGISFQRLFARLDGELDSRLEREREEAIVAELRFVEQDQRVGALRAKLDGLDRRISELGDVDALYHEALETKGRLLVERDDDHGRLVLSLAEQHAKACADRRELREAIECGGELARLLAEAARIIDQEIFDTCLAGRHSFVTAARNGKLDEAIRLINEAQGVFERFRKELSEVEGMALAELDDDEAENRSEGWLLVIADYFLQNKIERLAEDVDTLRAEVQQRLERLSAAEEANEAVRCERRKRLEEAIHTG